MERRSPVTWSQWNVPMLRTECSQELPLLGRSVPQVLRHFFWILDWNNKQNPILINSIYAQSIQQQAARTLIEWYCCLCRCQRRYTYPTRIQPLKVRLHFTTVLVVGGCSSVSLALFLRDTEGLGAWITTTTTTTLPFPTMLRKVESSCYGCNLLSLVLFCLMLL